MHINGPGNVQGPDPIGPNRLTGRRFEPVAAPRETDDAAEISELAQLKAQLKDVPDVRLEKIERLKAEIEAGTYETPDKIDTVIERLLEEL